MSAADLLRVEAAALTAGADQLDEGTVDAAVAILAGCTGKIVTTGAGTSGLVARKIAATLTSTGSPSMFLHPGDALHGGLGAVDRGDVVVAVSNSGETTEILALLPYLRHRGVALVAISGGLDSTLAGASDVTLAARTDGEICPFNLAPTSSTTLAMAIGDVLAVLLYEHHGLTPERFALNHPSGALGRRLTLRVRDVMHGGERLPTATPDTPFIEVVEIISDGGLGAVVVTNGDGSMAGLVTDGDLRRAVQARPDGSIVDVTAAEVMTASPTVVAPDVLIHDALTQMEDRPSQLSVLPVVDDGGCVGLVRVHDLVRAGAS